MLRLERTFHGNAQISGLLGSQFGKMHAEFGQVQLSHFFVELLGQEVNADGILLGMVPHLDLSDNLVARSF